MIKTFKDNKGRTWRLKVTFPVLRTMQDEGIADLFSTPDPLNAARMWLELDTVNKINAIDVAISQTDRQDQPFDAIDFQAAIDEEVIWNAGMAFAESLADFYPTHCELIHKILASAREKLEQSRVVMTEMTTSGEFNSKLDAIMDSELSGSGSINSQDSSESTPASSA